MTFSEGRLPHILYYTVQTNIFFCLWLAYSLLQKLGTRLPVLSPGISLAVTLYITITGIVYWVVLMPMLNADAFFFTPRNIWLHTVTPLYAVYAFLNSEVREPISKYQVFQCLSYPLFYFVSTFWINARFGKFPYPFLDADDMGGILPVILICGMIIFLFLGAGSGFARIYNRRSG